MTRRLPWRRAKTASARASATGSRLEVASSRTTTAAGDRYTRVSAMSCFSPAERSTPPAPTRASSPPSRSRSGVRPISSAAAVTDPWRQIGEVLPQRAGEDVRLLRDQAEQPGQIPGTDVTDVHAAEPDTAPLRWQQADEQVSQRGLAGAAGSD